MLNSKKPTHEEAITSLLANIGPLSYRQFPLRLYQIGTKFRDELKPKFGLMRTKEFLMKDCYSFDISSEMALNTYHQFCNVYTKIFHSISVPFVKVQGDTGIIGGSQSHEFHILADIGEELLLKCSTCNFAVNVEICPKNVNECPKCKSTTIEHWHGIEVGHTFLLDDKYTKVLAATFLQKNGKPAPLLMGCYGIGVTRLVAAAIETLATDTEIRWPFSLAPYTVCIIPPKHGSREESLVEHFTADIYNQLIQENLLKNDVIVDDRSSLTIGKRLKEAKRFGYPMIIIIGPKAIEDRFELHNDDKYSELNFVDLVQTISAIIHRNKLEIENQLIIQ